MKDLLDKLAGWILALCIIAALAVVVIVALKYPAEKQTYRIELTIKTDSTGCLTRESQAMVDSVIYIVENQNNVLRGKYDALAERETDNQKLMTIGGIIVTVVVSILGFFGFRSFQSIEEKAIEKAEGKAKKKLDEEMGVEIDRVKRIVETEMKEKFDDEIKPKVKTEVEAAIDEKYSADISAKINFINDKDKEIISLRDDVEMLKKRFSDVQDAGLDNDKDKPAESASVGQEEDELVKQIQERRKKRTGANKEKKGGES